MPDTFGVPSSFTVNPDGSTTPPAAPAGLPSDFDDTPLTLANYNLLGQAAGYTQTSSGLVIPAGAAGGTALGISKAYLDANGKPTTHAAGTQLLNWTPATLPGAAPFPFYGMLFGAIDVNNYYALGTQFASGTNGFPAMRIVQGGTVTTQSLGNLFNPVAGQSYWTMTRYMQPDMVVTWLIDPRAQVWMKPITTLEYQMNQLQFASSGSSTPGQGDPEITPGNGLFYKRAVGWVIVNGVAGDKLGEWANVLSPGI